MVRQPRLTLHSGTTVRIAIHVGVFLELIEVVKKIKSETNVSLPDVVEQKPSVREIELLSGFLCSVPFLTRDQMFEMFQTLTLASRLKLLVGHYSTYFKLMSIVRNSLCSKWTH